MTTAEDLRDLYQTRAHDADLDATDRAIAQHQLARLSPHRKLLTGAAAPSRWRHVPLAALVAQAGNALHQRSNGTFVSGHEPRHGSRSGTCLVIWPDEGRWWCSSCRTSGDAAGWLMQLHGCTAGEAAAILRERYGDPAQPTAAAVSRRSRRRPILRIREYTHG
jgi:hypothetical protein